MDIRLVI